MDLGLAGRRVLVTGGASNIGRAVVLAFAAEHARVAIADADVDQANRTAKDALSLGAETAFVTVGDLADPARGAASVADACDALDGLDVLVNNVGGARPARFQTQDRLEWTQVLALNLVATLTITRAALDAMMRQGRGGSIVSISSDAAWGLPGWAAYGAAKAGVISFARSVALEYGRYDIRSNVVAPALVLPSGDDAVGENSVWRARQTMFSDDAIEVVRRRTPLRRLPTAEDVAAAVVFLASEPMAGQLTGQLLSVSGGARMPW